MKTILKRVLVSFLAFSVLFTSTAPTSVRAAMNISGSGSGGSGGHASGTGPSSIQGYNIIIVGSRKSLKTTKMANVADNNLDSSKKKKEIPSSIKAGHSTFWGANINDYIFTGGDGVSKKKTTMAKTGVRQGLFYLYNTDVGEHTYGVIDGQHSAVGDIKDEKLYVNSTQSKMKSTSPTMVNPQSQIKSLESDSSFIGKGIFSADTEAKIPEPCGYNGSGEGKAVSFEVKPKGASKGTVDMAMLGMVQYGSKTGKQRYTENKWGLSDARNYYDNKLKSKWAAMCGLQSLAFSSGSGTPNIGNWCSRVAAQLEMQMEGMKRIKTQDSKHTSSSFYCGLPALINYFWLEETSGAGNLKKIVKNGDVYDDNGDSISDKCRDEIVALCKKVTKDKGDAEDLVTSFESVPSVIWKYIFNCCIGTGDDEREKFAKNTSSTDMIKLLRAACYQIYGGAKDGDINDFNLGYGRWTIVVTPVIGQLKSGTKSTLNLINGIYASDVGEANMSTILGGATHHTWHNWFKMCEELNCEGKITFGTKGYDTDYYKEKLTDPSDISKGNDWCMKNVGTKTTEIKSPKSRKDNNGFALAIVEPYDDVNPDFYLSIGGGSVTNQTVTINNSFKDVSSSDTTKNSKTSTNVYVGKYKDKASNEQFPYNVANSDNYESEEKGLSELRKLANSSYKQLEASGGTVNDSVLVSNSRIGTSTGVKASDGEKNYVNLKKNGVGTDAYISELNKSEYNDYIVADKKSSVFSVVTGTKSTSAVLKFADNANGSTQFGVNVSSSEKSAKTGKFGDGVYYTEPKFSNFPDEVKNEYAGLSSYLAQSSVHSKGKLVTSGNTNASVSLGSSDTKAGNLKSNWDNSSSKSRDALKDVSKSVSSKYSTVYLVPDYAEKKLGETTGWVRKNGIRIGNTQLAAQTEKVTNYNSTISNTGVLLQKNPTVYSTYSSYYIEMSEDVASSEGVCWYNGLNASDGTELSSLTEKQVYDIPGMNKTVKGADLPSNSGSNPTSYVYGLKGGLFKGNVLFDGTKQKPNIYEHKLFCGTTLGGKNIEEASTTYKKNKDGTYKVDKLGVKTTVTFDKDTLASKHLGEDDASPAMISNYAMLIERTNNDPNRSDYDWSEIITKILKSLNTRRNGDFYNTKNIIVGASGASKLESALRDAGVSGVTVQYLGQGSAKDIKKTSATVGSKVLDANNVVGYDIVTLSIKKANLPIVTAIHTNPDEVNHVYGDILGDRSTKSYANYTYNGTVGSSDKEANKSKIEYIGNDSTISGLYEKDNGSNIVAGRVNGKNYYYTTIAAAPKVSMFNVWNSAQTKVRWSSTYSKALADYSDAPYCSSSKVSVFRASYYTYYTTNPATHTKTSASNYFKNSQLKTGRSGLGDNTFGSTANKSADSVAGGNIPVNASKPKYNGWNNKGISGTSGTNAEKFTGTLMNDRADSTNPDGNSVYLLASGMLQNEGFVLTPNNNLNTGSGANKLYRVVDSQRGTPAYQKARGTDDFVYNNESLKIRVTGRMIYDFSGVGNRYNSGSASPNNVLVLKKSDIKLGSDGTEEGKNSIDRGTQGNASAGYGILQKRADSGNNVAKFANAQPDVKPVNDITNNTGTTAKVKIGNGYRMVNADGLETIYSRGLNARFRWNALGEGMNNRGKNNQLIAYDAEINEQDILDYMVICKNYTYQTMSTLGLLRKESDSIIDSNNKLKPLSTKSESEENSYMASKEYSDRFYSINGNNDKSRNYFVYSRNTGKYLSYYPEVGMKAYAFTDSNGNVKQVGENNTGAGYISYDGTGIAKNVTKRMIYTVGEAKRVFAQKSINIISTNIKDGNVYRPIESKDISSATVSDAIADSTDSTSNGNTGTDQKQVIYQGANINLNSSFNNKYLLLSNYTLDLPVGENASTAKNPNGKSVMLNGDVTYSGYTAQTILGMTGGKTNDLHNLWNHTSADGTTDNVGISALSNDFKSKYFAGTAHKKDENGADIDGAATDEQFEAWASQVEKAIKPDITLVMSENNAIRNVYKDFNKTALKVELAGTENKDDINKRGTKQYNSYMIIVKDGKIVTDPSKRFNYETGLEDNSTSGTYSVSSDWVQLVTDVAKDMGYDTSTESGWSSESAEFKEVAKYIEKDSGMLVNLENSMMTLGSKNNHSITKESTTEHFGDDMSVFNGITGNKVTAGATADTTFGYQGVAYNDGGETAGYGVNTTANKWYSENTSVFIVRRSTRRLNLKSVVTQDKLDIGSGPSKVTNDTTLQDIAEDSQESTGISSTWDAKWYLRLFLSGDGMSDSNNYVLNGGDASDTDTYLIGESDRGKNKEDKATWGIHLEGADFLVPDATTSDMRR